MITSKLDLLDLWYNVPMKKGEYRECPTCKKLIYFCKTELPVRKYCSHRCARLGKPGVIFSEETKRKIAESVSKYIKEHPEHGGLHYWSGRSHTEGYKRKMRKSTTGNVNKGKFKKGKIPWNKNITLPDDTKLKISKKLEGHKMTARTKKKMRKSGYGKHSGIKPAIIAFQRILEEIPELEKQGFRCIPIGQPIPDIVAIRDGKIYAIEIERQKNPNYKKYEGIEYYDEVIWVLKHKYAKKQGDVNTL